MQKRTCLCLLVPKKLVIMTFDTKKTIKLNFRENSDQHRFSPVPIPESSTVPEAWLPLIANLESGLNLDRRLWGSVRGEGMRPWGVKGVRGWHAKKKNQNSYHLLYLSPAIYFSFIDTQLKCNHLCRSLCELPLAEHVSWVLAILHGLFTYLTLPYGRPPSGQKTNQRHQIYLCILSILKYLILIFW